MVLHSRFRPTMVTREYPLLHERSIIHSLLGSALYGAVVVKVLMVRSSRFAGWALPVAGGLLFAILLGLWLTSALLFFAGGLSAP